MNARKRREIFRRLATHNPSPHTELAYNCPFQLLVAVILSAQATDASVNAATGPLFAQAPTPEAMLALGEQGLRQYIRRIGLANSKARHIVGTCKLLIERHGGEVPGDRAALEALPGVGRKTANVVLNTVFRQPTMAVDTHIFRVSNRTGLARGATVREVEQKLLRYVPKEYRLNAHHWLILHGRYVCSARRPRCPECSICDLCDYRDKVTDNRASATVRKGV